ncbi:Gfo/Idh/MocA family protein [uncultured Fibrella sp.]|uniref:Gfo/Idh/MocA family protein n=1 Tax=uncultured Fibrella sp. TaxID=1284596 RepID=UPI0035CA271E
MTSLSASNRRTFLKQTTGIAALSALAPSLQASPTFAPRIKFSVVGINHGHIYSQVESTIRGGGELVSVYAKEPELLAAFTKRYPQVKVARSEDEVLSDKSTQLILTSGIPDERAGLGIRVMKAGKDFMTDKPGITTLEQLAQVRKVQQETKRIYSIMFSERFENKATVKAGELVKAGAIGQVIQTIGLGPHRISLTSRPEWFFDKKRFGGIICDIASHQVDQFLFFTGSTKGEVLSSQTGNVHYPQYPNFEDFGDLTLRGDKGAGYIRVDWFTPDGLNTWGDGRLTILGTEGYIEIRKNVDIAGRTGGSHLFMVDKKETRYIDCSKQDLPYGTQLVDDILNRTETAMTQAHCFLATELALKAQKHAQKLTIA